jgi:hypothetical protein
MNRTEATTLLQRYRDFPATNVFEAKPFNYPLFHLLECFSKGWNIQLVDRRQGCHIMVPVNDINFEWIGKIQKQDKHILWQYVATNPVLAHPILGFVQQDLYCRYVGRCNPLKGPNTSWTFIPFNNIINNPRFLGKIGKSTELYLIEIDLDIVDIKGESREDVPWHYLQQTIDWKPYTDRIEWQNENQPTDEQPRLIMEDHPLRIR